MGKVVAIVAILVAVGVAYLFNKNYYFPVKIPPQQDGYFGAGAKKSDDPKIVPFTINVSDSILDDLYTRLDNTRWYEPLENVKFEYGFNTDYLKSVQKHWRTSYDWKTHEAQLNKMSHFKTEIEGLKIHFVESKPPSGKYKRVVPLLLVHGWPGSVYEFYKILPMLSDPKAKLGLDDRIAFHVIAPSIPGYGWSDAPKKKGFDPVSAARVFHKLMRRLRFEQYFCQGGDWGSIISVLLAQSYPQEVLGLHINMAFVSPVLFPGVAVQLLIGSIAPSLVVHPTDYNKLYPFWEKLFKVFGEIGYMWLQASKPDTVGFGLNDSPVGLAAYILEKFSTWTNSDYRSFADGGLTRHFTLDELLTNVMIYWTTGTIASSQRFYKEHFANEHHVTYESAPVLVPTGVASFPRDLYATYPRNFLAYKYRNITSYTEMPRGGHFAAFEEPKLLAEDIFRFAMTV